MLTNDHPMLDIVFLLLTLGRRKRRRNWAGGKFAGWLRVNAFETEILANIQAQLPGSKLRITLDSADLAASASEDDR